MENTAQKTATKTATKTASTKTTEQEVILTPEQALEKSTRKTLKGFDGNKSKISSFANETRRQFIDALGLPAASNNSGYKFDATRNQEKLDSAISAYVVYRTIVNETGTYRPILAKMERNLRNSDRASKFAQLERETAKKATQADESKTEKAA